MPVTCAFPAHRCALRGTTGAYGFREFAIGHRDCDLPELCPKHTVQRKSDRRRPAKWVATR